MSSTEASALADDLGVDVVMLYTDSLGDGIGAATYAELMRYDASDRTTALGELPWKCEPCGPELQRSWSWWVTPFTDNEFMRTRCGRCC